MLSFLAIEIDLKSKDLATTTKYYGRLQIALANAALSKFTMQIQWDPPFEKDATKQICPSSVAKYLSDLGYDVNVKQTECKMNLEYGLKMPKLAPPPAAIETDELVEIDGEHKFNANPHELVEYAGMLALSCNRERIAYLNTWACSGHTVDVGSALCVRLTGLFSCNLIKTLFWKLR